MVEYVNGLGEVIEYYQNLILNGDPDAPKYYIQLAEIQYKSMVDDLNRQADSKDFDYRKEIDQKKYELELVKSEHADRKDFWNWISQNGIGLLGIGVSIGFGIVGFRYETKGIYPTTSIGRTAHQSFLKKSFSSLLQK